MWVSYSEGSYYTKVNFWGKIIIFRKPELNSGNDHKGIFMFSLIQHFTKCFHERNVHHDLTESNNTTTGELLDN